MQVQQPEVKTFRQQPELDALAAWCACKKNAAPCAVVACAYPTHNGWAIDEGAAGHLAPGLDRANTNTIFDLASLTKPFSALTLARLVRNGALDWHTPLHATLPHAFNTPSAKVPLEWLAAHRSGLESHRPLFAPLELGQAVDRSRAITEACFARCQESVANMPSNDGFPPVYSDLGYLLLGEAMAATARLDLDTLIAREVCEPLELAARSARQWRAWDKSFDERVAPTEHVAWRGGMVRGVVHDENAWAIAQDGVCGHAGLFGTARDVARLGVAVLDACRGNRPKWLSKDCIEPLVRERQGGSLRAGFDGKSLFGSSAGKFCSPATFGHLGFTGTSIWIDPSVQVTTVLLTNRVCPTRDSGLIKKVRPMVHDELFAWGTSHARQ